MEPNSQRLTQELNRFDKFLSLQSSHNPPIPDVLLLNGADAQGSAPIDIVIMGITHGVEVAGLAVINRVLDALQVQKDGTTKNFSNLSMAFILGNRPAALEQKRYLQSDLNRSFGNTSPLTAEQKRANQIEPILKRAKFFFDLHQTFSSSESVFFIFPWQMPSIQLCMSMLVDAPIVTHWGKPFSADGCCSDEYVHRFGGAGLTIELGQNGYGHYAITSGIAACMEILCYARSAKSQPPILRDPTEQLERFFTISQSIDAVDDLSLEPGFTNFKEVSKGQCLARSTSGREVIAHLDGWTLFPYYPHPARGTQKPSELGRVLRRIRGEELKELSKKSG